MTAAWSLFGSLVLFLIGVRLSAFFSGSETGFYRVSTLQVTLQRQRGDSIAKRLYFFVTHPERFVATTLVGNNIANYITTLAIGFAVGAVASNSSGAMEVLATLLITPVIFIFGELIPKGLFYRAPMSQLRAGAWFFRICYLVFLPISYPLIVVSRFVSKLRRSDKRPMEVVFGRNRLYGVLEAGQEEGILTGLQRDLAENLMQTADIPIEQSMLPLTDVVGLPVSCSVEELTEFASRYHSAWVLLYDDESPKQWKGAVRVADVLANPTAPRHAMRDLPAFTPTTPQLEVLTQLMKQFAPWGLVEQNGNILGVIRRQTLVSRAFRVTRPAAAE